MLLTCLSIPAQKKGIDEKILVVYFSHSGNTRTVAEQITRSTGADLFEIQPQDCHTMSCCIAGFTNKIIAIIFGHSISDMKKLCPDASFLEGLAIRDSYVNDNCQDVVKWLQTLKLLK